ncbi:MAG: proton-conducting transporter membrane subunit [Pseudomonadota bacterium]|nr:proton-conducting transporter membrane subunit [Pseudomonadota bacterium]
MNNTLSVFLLLSVPGLPLLLVLLALRSRLSWPCHLALLPAVILVAVPTAFSVEVPWLLFGTGLGIGGGSRLLLAMSVVLWAAAATLLPAPAGQPADNRLTTFFLLTLAGNLGVILATDLVGFFTFSALIGYGFYGLLVDGGDKTARRAGRVYLGFMILADLALFEVLLIAAATTGDLGFEVVRHAIALSPASGLYLSMVLAGFALKAGVLPLHFWLPLAFRSARPSVALLLGGVPVAMGLLGMAHWLPLGELTLPDLGAGIQWVGLAAAVYGTVVGLMQSHPRTLLAYAGIVVTSLFVTILGSGLEWPLIGSAIQGTAHLFILTLGLILAALVPASLLTDKAKARLALLVAGHAAGTLLLALAPVMILFLTRIPAGSVPHFADSGMLALWPWWTLCTTLLALRWIYLLLHRQQEVVSVPVLKTGAVWGVLLVAAYASGLLAAVWSDDPMGVLVDVWWPFVLGILIGGSVWWMAAKRKLPSIPTIPPGDLWSILEWWFSRGNRWSMSMGLQVLPRWRASGLAVAGRLLRVRAWQKVLDAGERSLQSWTLAVALLLLMAIAIALLST